MLIESLLAYAHLVCILTLVVFVTSEAALCRVEWINGAVVKRLARVDMLYMFAAIAVLATGLARTAWGVKGMGWYWHQPLLHAKVTLFVVIGLISIKPTISFRRWARQWDATQTLPPDQEVRAIRRWIMVQAHLIVLLPLAGSFLARGIWTR